jgi:hypothetical protein
MPEFSGGGSVIATGRGLSTHAQGGIVGWRLCPTLLPCGALSLIYTAGASIVGRLRRHLLTLCRAPLGHEVLARRRKRGKR